MDGDSRRAAYAPQIAEFLRIRSELGVDPEGMFENDFTARYLAPADSPSISRSG